MKNLILLLALLVASSVLAQNKMQWHAVYRYKQILSEKDKARRDSLMKAQPAMAEVIKKVYKRIGNRTYTMDFSRNESVFKEEKKLESPGNNTMITGIRDRKLYKNIQEKTYLYKRPAMDEVFIISDSLPVYKWKITNESKQIGNYTVIKAETQEPTDSEKKITAWFTPEIPVQNGPKKYWGLPGLIMEVSNGKDVYLCTQIVVNPKDKFEITKPKDGKIVDEETYKNEMKKMREKLRKRYKNRRGDKNTETIRIRL